MNVYEANEIIIPDGSVECIRNLNGVILWEKKVIPDTKDTPFYIERVSGSGTWAITFKRWGNSLAQNSVDFDVEVSNDKINWTKYSFRVLPDGEAVINNDVNTRKVYIRANVRKLELMTERFTIVTTGGSFNIGGNIMSLLYGSDFTGDETTFPNTGSRTRYFHYLFYNNSTLVDASKLLLPVLSLAENCYTCMFAGCTSLTKAPNLPATEMAQFCYASMFKMCTSLIKTPSFGRVNNNWAARCCQSMFSGCTSLERAILFQGTYNNSSLNTFELMFSGCTSLQSIVTNACSPIAGHLYNAWNCWVENVSPTGIMYGVRNNWEYSDSCVPYGWEVEQVG